LTYLDGRGPNRYFEHMATVRQNLDQEVITREEWAWVEGLVRDVARQEESDVFARRLFQWDLVVRQFRKIEHKRIVLGAPTATDFDFHARCLQGLLGIGHALVLDAQKFEPEALARLGIKGEEIAAYVEELEQSFREWHHGFSEQELEKVRQAAFSAKA